LAVAGCKGSEMDKEKWLEEDGVKFLRRIGIGRGQIFLDFGCGSGNYTIPAAKIVGKEGIVYALDKNKRTLDELMRRVEVKELGNIRRMEASGQLKIGLEEESVDVVLLYDVIHHYYFPRAEDRGRILREVHRVLRPNGFVSFYAGDPEVYHNYQELEIIERQIEDANFYLESEHSGMLVHEGMLVKGKVLNFRKRPFHRSPINPQSA
jgi:ubiquinone/menaquinone biosynthesis C-methylase UbiE